MVDTRIVKLTLQPHGESHGNPRIPEHQGTRTPKYQNTRAPEHKNTSRGVHGLLFVRSYSAHCSQRHGLTSVALERP